MGERKRAIAPFRERAPWWGGDLQTVRNQLLGDPGAPPGAARELWFDTADGDRMCVVLNAPAQLDPSAPLVLLVHGLTGDADSYYVRRSATNHLERGRRVARLNLRGAGPSRPVCRRLYNASAAPDLAEAVTALAAEIPSAGLVAMGYSLGGAIAIHWLARHADPALVRAGAAVSPPLIPLEVARRIAEPRNAVYQSFLLKGMRDAMLRAPTPPSAADQAAMAAARTVYDFDDAIVAPWGGWRDAIAYYDDTAAGPWVAEARAPLLLIHADNDPWIPAAPHRRAASAAPAHVRVEITRGGGHVGFHDAGSTTPWHDRAFEAFLSDQL